MPSSVPLQAFADESFLEAPEGGYYILAAAIVEQPAKAAARETMRSLLGKRTAGKLHWHEMEHAERKHAAQAVAALDGFHLVIVGSPLPARKQDRARAICLERLVTELHAWKVGELCLESRNRTSDSRDLRTIIGARYNLPKGTRFTVDHQPGFAEPLLWLADIVAGAVRLDRQGDAACRMVLADHLLEVVVDTKF